ncbi:MAG: RNA chaperone Hfq [Candidatus Muiribacteriota bacterium]
MEKVFSTKAQDHIINTSRRKKIPLTFFLKNGLILKGTVMSFDQFTIEIFVKKRLGKKVEPNTKPEINLVYKSSLLTIIPTKKIPFES